VQAQDPVEASPALNPLMDGRVTYLQSVTEVAAVAPSINNIKTNTGIHRMGDTVWIQASVTGGTTVLLNYRNTRVAPFEWQPPCTMMVTIKME
jgi:hypothetical protein